MFGEVDVLFVGIIEVIWSVISWTWHNVFACIEVCTVGDTYCWLPFHSYFCDISTLHSCFERSIQIPTLISLLHVYRNGWVYTLHISYLLGVVINSVSWWSCLWNLVVLSLSRRWWLGPFVFHFLNLIIENSFCCLYRVNDSNSIKLTTLSLQVIYTLWIEGTWCVVSGLSRWHGGHGNKLLFLWIIGYRSYVCYFSILVHKDVDVLVNWLGL